jgi:hypothetical protein
MITLDETSSSDDTNKPTTLNSNAFIEKDELMIINLSPEDQVQEYMNEFLSASKLVSSIL